MSNESFAMLLHIVAYSAHKAYSVIGEKWKDDIRNSPNNEVVDEIIEEEVASSSSHMTQTKKNRKKKKRKNKMAQSTGTDKETLDSNEEPIRMDFDDEISVLDDQSHTNDDIAMQSGTQLNDH
ncbi:unnamed protein product [Rhizophagus irregularis]|nr:unnamed protein product [Rhizophagus irregularis]CAB5383496.1 unnamed protein product [Rhizophagus irregularis]